MYCQQGTYPQGSAAHLRTLSCCSSSHSYVPSSPRACVRLLLSWLGGGLGLRSWSSNSPLIVTTFVKWPVKYPESWRRQRLARWLAAGCMQQFSKGSTWLTRHKLGHEWYLYPVSRDIRISSHAHSNLFGAPTMSTPTSTFSSSTKILTLMGRSRIGWLLGSVLCSCLGLNADILAFFVSASLLHVHGQGHWLSLEPTCAGLRGAPIV